MPNLITESPGPLRDLEASLRVIPTGILRLLLVETNANGLVYSVWIPRS